MELIIFASLYQLKKYFISTPIFYRTFYLRARQSGAAFPLY